MFRDQLVREVQEGTAQDCFAAHLYENRKEYGLDDTEAMFAGTHPISFQLLLTLSSQCR
jgi:hypothetical protein